MIWMYGCGCTTHNCPHIVLLSSITGHLIAGAFAGAASRTATAPLETLRLAVMTGTLESPSLREVRGDGRRGGGLTGAPWRRPSAWLS